MSFFAQSQSVFSQQGWLPLGARVPTPPREHFGLPLSYVAPVIGGVTLGITTTSPIWF